MFCFFGTSLYYICCRNKIKKVLQKKKQNKERITKKIKIIKNIGFLEKKYQIIFLSQEHLGALE
jgi:hypothetical protein